MVFQFISRFFWFIARFFWFSFFSKKIKFLKILNLTDRFLGNW
jgi:hypothetical protein